jgi:ankyrin repeat protein
VELLLDRGADINAKSKPTEGINAILELNVDSVDAGLFQAYAKTPLHLAWDEEIATLLMAGGADINAREEAYDRTPLHLITEKFFGDIEEIAELLILSGADVNALDRDGRTPLHFAANNRHKDVVEYLLVGGAEINIQDREGVTPLDVAGETSTYYAYAREPKHQLEVIEVLLLNGARANSRNVLQISKLISLESAKALGYFEIAKILTK